MRLVDIEPFENHLQEMCDNFSNSPQHAPMKIITMGYLKKLRSFPTVEPERMTCDGCKWEYAFGYGECHHCKRNFDDLYEEE